MWRGNILRFPLGKKGALASLALYPLFLSLPPTPPPLLPHPWLGRHSLNLFISVGNVFREAQRILRLSSSNYRRTAVEVQMPVKQKPSVRSINYLGSNKVQSTKLNLLYFSQLQHYTYHPSVEPEGEKVCYQNKLVGHLAYSFFQKLVFL